MIPGERNEEGLKFYDDVFDELNRAGIEPLVTLSHYENPWYLTEKYNGWADRRLVNLFLKFAEVCFTRYRDKVKYWLTFNEINPDFKIGCMVALTANYAYSANPLDQVANQLSWQYCNYYCGDVHVRGEYPGFAKRIWKENGVNLVMEEGDAEILKEGTVDSFYWYQKVIRSNGEGFTLLSHRQGDKVKAGEALIEYDAKKLSEKYDTTVMFVITDDNGKEVNFKAYGRYEAAEEITE